MPIYQPLAERFWTKVQINGPDDCWPWIAAKDEHGYGTVRVSRPRRRQVRAHRAAWELTYGPIPNKMYVLHRCDNPPCCNPRHLFVGDDGDNVRDAWKKGRMLQPPGVCMPGETNPMSKLNSTEISKIRVLSSYGMRQQMIAAVFGVTQSNVSHIVTRKTWRHLP